ncbi:hypothetical protein [Acuticoccus mangrovi]|uniref:Uncharacterized protein n=1 Tax=Acuticoccus mangrovi TaxID=2796142 RepID=A0A934MFI1_9HYPH|nr:hypothetical protein [Acuticoccus mangrovi]MBJ3778692.1 hypothetical protein [Acuticoccus mangrovi]
MRRFADTLPTLRDPAASPSLTPEPGFTPAVIARAFGPRPLPGGDPVTAETVGGTLERAFARLDRGGPVAPGGSASPRLAFPGAGEVPPVAPSRRTSPIPPLDGAASAPDDRLAQAVAAAQKEAEAQKSAAMETVREVERRTAKRALEEARAAWCREEAEVIHGRIEPLFEALHRRLSDAFGAALAPIAETAIRDAALRRFASVLDDLIGPEAAEPAVTIKGPADLLDALRSRFGERAGVNFIEETTVELSVDVGDTRLETVVGAWADDLATSVSARDVQ